MKADLHIHTNVSSPCSFIDPEMMIKRAMAIGMDAVCVTEHEEIKGAEVAREIGDRYEIRVFRGIEVYTEFGDMLVYGLYRDAPGWKTPLADLLEMCEEAGAAVVIAHPCRVPGELERIHGEERTREILGRLTAVETHNGGSTPRGNAAALELAHRYGLPGTGGSDAHHEFQVGRCFTVFDDDLTSDEDLVAALKSGRYHGAYR